MSVIKTERGWVELGAANPLERAFETSGYRTDRVTSLVKPLPFVLDWTHEQVRAWNVRLAKKAGVNYCTTPCRCPSGCSCTLLHHSHKTNWRTLPVGVVLFGKYGPEWTI